MPGVIFPGAAKGDAVVGVGGSKITFSPIVGHFILGDPGGGDGVKPAKIWAVPPGWGRAGGGESGDVDARDGDNPSKHAPGGTFFVGVGGSKIAGFGSPLHIGP